MPAGRGEEERFADAAKPGTTPDPADEADFARELEILAMLRSPQAADVYGPDPDSRAQAKTRLMAAFAQEHGTDREAAPSSTGSAQRTAPIPSVSRAPIGVPVADGPTTRIEPAADVPACDVTEVIARVEPAADAGAAVGGTERVLHDGGTETTTRPSPGRRGRHQMPSRPAARPRDRRVSTGRGVRKRMAAVGSAAMVLMVALTSVGVLASRDAVPGDGLYALKRVAESASLALTFDDEAKARQQLGHATARLDEVERMLARPQAAAAPDPELFRSAILDFDAATSEGAQALLGGEDDVDAAADVADLRAWASEQAARLSGMRSVLPLTVLTDTDESIALLERLRGGTDDPQPPSSCPDSELTGQPGPTGQPGLTGQTGLASPSDDCAPVATEATTPGSSGTTGSDPAPTTSGGPTGSATGVPDEEDEPPVLPDVTPRGSSAPMTSSAGSGSTTTTPSTEPERFEVPLPLPLMPPISLPPLAPGSPGVTIG